MPVQTGFVATQDQRVIHARIRAERDEARVEEGFSWKDLKIFRAYTNGKHNVVLTDKQRELLRNMLGNKFCDNICYDVISQTTGRITFTGWKCKNETVQKWLNEFFRTARIQNRQSDVHYRSVRDGNFVLAVNWDEKRQRVQVYKEDWWDGEKGVYIHYDDADEPEYAVKEWLTVKRTFDGTIFSSQRIWHRTIWFEDRVERWISIDNSTDLGWTPAPLDTDVVPDEEGEGNTKVWPMPWLDENGEPIGIPYVHFPNAAKTYGNYGVSELDGGVIGFQDQLNDAHYQLSINTRFTGGQMYYATGVKPKNKAGTDEAIPQKMEPGLMLTSPNADSTFGVLQAGNPDSIIKSYDTKLKSVARMTSTPLHSITGGDWPSGDALLRAELPAVNKARKQIGQYQDCWTTVGVLGMKIYNIFKPNKQPVVNYDIEDGIVEAEFADPEKRDAISRSIIVHNLAENISKKEALRIMDYSEERTQEIYEEILEEESDSAEALATTLATRAVNGVTVKSKQASNSGGNNKPDSRPV